MPTIQLLANKNIINCHGRLKECFKPQVSLILLATLYGENSECSISDELREAFQKKTIESVSMLKPAQASVHTSLGFFLHAINLLVWI